MNPRQVWIHAGLPKTGSSAVQMFLGRHRDVLRRLGYAYPGLGHRVAESESAGTSGNGMLLALAMSSTAGEMASGFDRTVPLHALFAHLEATDAHTTILSSEYFSTWTGSDYARLKAELAARGVALRVLLYLREQVLALSSTYVQNIKVLDMTAGPDAFARFALPNVRHLYYDRLLADWMAALGPAHVTARLYTRQALKDGDVCRDLLEAVGITDHRAFAPVGGQINHGLSAQWIAVKRVLNRASPTRATHLRFLQFAHAMEPDQRSPSCLFSPQLAAEICEHFRAGNERAAALMQPARAAPLFAPVQWREPPSTDPDQLDRRWLVSTLARLAVFADSQAIASPAA